MKKLIHTLCFFCCIQTNIFSESIFTMELKKDIIISSLSLSIFASPFFVHNTPAHTPAPLDKNTINAFDRPLLFPYNKPLDIISDYGVYSMLLLPIISAIPHPPEIKPLFTYGAMYTEALLLTFGTKELLKNTLIRYRPYMYTEGIPTGKENDYYNSFPSGSTSLGFLGATFLSTTFLYEYPESKWKIPVLIGSYTLAAGIASMRILSGSHFLTDVLTGAALGSLYGWLIPWLHLKNNNKTVTLVPTGNGFFLYF